MFRLGPPLVGTFCLTDSAPTTVMVDIRLR